MNPRTVLVRDVMSKDIAFVEPSATLRAAARRMRELDVSCLLLPPPDEHGAPGILTQKDIVGVLIHENFEALDEVSVEDVATRPAICADQDLCLADCLGLMRLAGVRRLPILEDGKPVGILSYGDVMGHVV